MYITVQSPIIIALAPRPVLLDFKHILLYICSFERFVVLVFYPGDWESKEIIEAFDSMLDR
jgi:hypothetical protein